MSSIYIQPICDNCDPVPARYVCECVEKFYVGCFDVVRPINPIPPPPDCRYNGKGNRLRVEKLVSFLGQRHDGIILGLTNEDISGSKDGRLDWGVLGYAEGRTCVLSTYRMGGRQDRLGKAAVHEVGHLLGLGHCSTPGCLMNDARGKLSTLDGASDMCGPCKVKAGVGLRTGTIFSSIDTTENEMTDTTGISGVKMRTFVQIGLGSIAAAASRMADVGVGQQQATHVVLRRAGGTPGRPGTPRNRGLRALFPIGAEYIHQTVVLAGTAPTELNWPQFNIPLKWGEFNFTQLLVNGARITRPIRSEVFAGQQFHMFEPLRAPKGSLIQAVYTARREGSYITPGEVVLQELKPPEFYGTSDAAPPPSPPKKRLTSVRRTPTYSPYGGGQYSFGRFGIAGPFAPTVPQQTGVGGVQWEDDDSPREMYNGYLGKTMTMRPSELRQQAEEYERR